MTSADVIDTLAQLAPDSETLKARHDRPKVVAATQSSFEALFDPALASLPLETRLLVAVLACRLTGMDAMAAFYRAKLGAHPALAAVDGDNLAAIADPALRAALTFTETLTQKPVEGDRQAIVDLKAAGLSDAAIVTLGQMIGFLSYQTRMVAGLAALQAFEAKGGFA